MIVTSAGGGPSPSSYSTCCVWKRFGGFAASRDFTGNRAYCKSVQSRQNLVDPIADRLRKRGWARSDDRFDDVLLVVQPRQRDRAIAHVAEAELGDRFGVDLVRAARAFECGLARV